MFPLCILLCTLHFVMVLPVLSLEARHLANRQKKTKRASSKVWTVFFLHSTVLVPASSPARPPAHARTHDVCIRRSYSVREREGQLPQASSAM